MPRKNKVSHNSVNTTVYMDKDVLDFLEELSMLYGGFSRSAMINIALRDYMRIYKEGKENEKTI